MFWLTPATSIAPDDDTASSLLASPSRPTAKGRRTSEMMRNYASSPSSGSDGKGTIILKIGRASNVHRRMNEWTRQCNHHLSLIRFYPYLPNSSAPPFTSPSPIRSPTQSASFLAPPSSPRKVPHVHKIERLIHLELADKRVKRDCEACGKEHREWFEVEGTREGVRRVDTVVRRWVEWGERDGHKM